MAKPWPQLGQSRNYGFPIPVSFYDTDRSTALTGANRPKIKMFHWTMTKSDTNITYGSVFAVDTEGFLYTCGYNCNGQLGLGHRDDINIFIILYNYIEFILLY